jgi:hypothetical protein
MGRRHCHSLDAVAITAKRGMIMLTKAEVVKLTQSILQALPDHEFLDEIDDAALKLNKQAHLAITLQAELTALKAHQEPCEVCFEYEQDKSTYHIGVTWERRYKYCPNCGRALTEGCE